MTAGKRRGEAPVDAVPRTSVSGTGRGRFFTDIVVGDVPLDEVSSAIQKAIRRGHSFEAAFWVRHLVTHGFGRYAVKKLSIVAAEDVGLADPSAVMFANALIEMGVRVTGKTHPQGADLKAAEMHLVGAALALARAKHSRTIPEICAVAAHRDRVGARPAVRAEALDMHTARGRAAGLRRGSPASLTFWQEHSRVLANEEVIDENRWRDELDEIWAAQGGFSPVDDAEEEG